MSPSNPKERKVTSMSGSIRPRKQKNGKVTYQVIIERGTDGNGKRLRDFYSYKTKKEAQQALAEKLSQLSHNTYTEPSKLTVAEALDQWYTTSVEPNHKENTKRGYKVNIDHIKTGLGSVVLQRLTAMQIQSFYNGLEAKGFSPRSIQYIHTNLKSCLKYYNKMQVLSNNQADFATVPKQVKAQNDCYTEKEVTELLSKAKETDIYLEILLGVGMGLRRGEVLSLTWKDVDFAKGTLSVNKSVSTIKGKTVVSTTKTASGERKLKIPSFVLEALRERKQKQWADRKALGGAYTENDLVCCKSSGEYYNCGSFTKKFSNLLKKLELRHIRFHDLRHTNATLMMSYGVPIKVISENLGHASTGVTLDTYSHVTSEMKEEVAEKFDGELFAKIG